MIETRQILYCPLHAQASAMAEFVRALADGVINDESREGLHIYEARALDRYRHDARALLRALDGEA